MCNGQCVLVLQEPVNSSLEFSWIGSRFAEEGDTAAGSRYAAQGLSGATTASGATVGDFWYSLLVTVRVKHAEPEAKHL